MLNFLYFVFIYFFGFFHTIPICNGVDTLSNSTMDPLEIVSILSTLNWQNPIFMTSSFKMAKGLAVKIFAEQHQAIIMTRPKPLKSIFTEDMAFSQNTLVLIDDYHLNTTEYCDFERELFMYRLIGVKNRLLKTLNG